MDFLSALGSYGLRRFLDVVANIMLKFGLRFVDKLMDGDTTFTARGGDTSLPGSGVGSGVVAERQMSGCGHCVIVVEFQDASQFSGEISLVVP